MAIRKRAGKDHLYRIEQAEKRDHRKLGRQLDLFHLGDGPPGLCSGTQGLEALLQLLGHAGSPRGGWYVEVNTPT